MLGLPSHRAIMDRSDIFRSDVIYLYAIVLQLGGKANSNSSVSILDGFERQVTAAAVRSPLRSIRHTHVLPDLVVKFTAKSQFSH